MSDQTTHELPGSEGAVPVPGADGSPSRAAPGWRVRFELASDRGIYTEFEVSGDIVLGVAADVPGPDISLFKANDLGVSRRHARLHPTNLGLLITDTGSTNGTRLNGYSLEPGKSYPLSDGDLLALGNLELVVRITDHPDRDPHERLRQLDLADALTKMAKVITSQLDLDEVLNQALEMVILLTMAQQATIWLIDEQSGELFLVAERGLEDETIRRMRLPVTNPLVSKVIQTRQALRASRAPTGELVKVKTGYMVEALLYIPLIQGDTVIGVLSAAHQEPDKVFSVRDAKLLEGVADFAAIAIQNSRMYHTVQEADRLKGEMIQNISHEFRTPLTYIIGYVELLMEESAGLNPEQRHNLAIISQQADRLLWLVKNFVVMQTAGDIALKASPLDINTLLAEVVETTQLQAAKNDIELAIAITETLPPVMGNSMSILQVMDNLLSNALKFTPAGGKVTVEAGLSRTGTEVVISITDTGIGIPHEDLSRVFERFVQLDGSSTRRFGGVGLGLSVCKQIVEAHGGKIWIDSTPGEGAIFSFTLPLASE